MCPSIPSQPIHPLIPPPSPLPPLPKKKPSQPKYLDVSLPNHLLSYPTRGSDWQVFTSLLSRSSIYSLPRTGTMWQQASLDWEKSLCDCFQIERNMIVVIVFLLIMNLTDFRLVRNQKKNCHCDDIPFDLNEIKKWFLWMYHTMLPMPSSTWHH